jgi:uncharacterized protein YndB with AHSA1/START domain
MTKGKKMAKYEVTVSASIRTVWEADSKDEALRQAEAWTAEEYGDLVHKANFGARELS